MRLIIDTDTAGDDCFSILLALQHPAATLEAVTICNGNIAFDQQVENALITLEMAGRGGSVPVYPGCRLPMLRKPVDAAYVFGADGMSDGNFPQGTAAAGGAARGRRHRRPRHGRIPARSPSWRRRRSPTSRSPI